ncbi:hypothetical protein CPB84DRAFT_1691803 [Gymnopilus junonius]|uniref:Zinc finger PHD-type domain-containing protein n=1 Tax=Gymnopilus junonius TaxID=109634 RepID=A0A9P5TG33_GYMJU|nr:hypothetical protein CPB84DRAFT_1691803 [Gymnopilus junonius]
MLNECLCKKVIDLMMDVAIECKRAGCETQWYHLQCMKLNYVLWNWVCEACMALGMARRSKRFKK